MESAMFPGLSALEPPLLEAARHRDYWQCARLLKADADPDQRDAFGRTALIFAARWGWAGVCRVLLA